MNGKNEEGNSDIPVVKYFKLDVTMFSIKEF
jgi:hypothetical protein